MRNFDCVIWDWNGTLIDDVEIALGAVNDTLSKLGRPHIDLADYYKCMRDGMSRYYEYLLYPDSLPYDELTKLFSEFYDRRVENAHLHKNAESVLRKIKRENISQVIVSSSHNYKVKRDVERFGIGEYFDELLGADDLLVGSKVERAKNYLERHGFERSRTLVVGDMVHDVEMANELGVPYVIVPKGHQNEQRLKELKAVMIADISEVAEMLNCANSDFI